MVVHYTRPSPRGLPAFVALHRDRNSERKNSRKTLHQAALDRFGSEAEVAHKLRLEARRRHYAATTPGPRVFPVDTDFVRVTVSHGNQHRAIVIPRPDWGTDSYVKWFEAANHLKPINGETA